jgi:hypothetical protein
MDGNSESESPDPQRLSRLRAKLEEVVEEADSLYLERRLLAAQQAFPFTARQARF